MRTTWGFIAIVLCLFAGTARAEEDAAAYFKKVETALADAATLRIKFKAEVKGGKDTPTEGILATRKAAAGEKDKLRYEIVGEHAGQKGKAIIVSDGKTMKFADTGPDGKMGDAESLELPENLGRNFVALVLRGGSLIGPHMVGDMKYDTETVSNFTAGWSVKLGAKEKVGNHDAQAIELQMIDKQKGSYATTLWVDAKSLLPLRLTLVSKMIGPGGNETHAETWDEVEVGKEIDDKTFDLPK